MGETMESEGGGVGGRSGGQGAGQGGAVLLKVLLKSLLEEEGKRMKEGEKIGGCISIGKFMIIISLPCSPKNLKSASSQTHV